MALISHKPTTPSKRGYVSIDRSELYKGKPVKSLVKGLSRTGGRNNTGRITTRHVGGGHKKRYRMVDFKRKKYDMDATVERIEYDPNRTAFIALLKYTDGELAYIIAPRGLAVGHVIQSSRTRIDVRPGNCCPLEAMPLGSVVHNIEMKPGKGAQMVRSAGCSAELVGRDRQYAQIRLTSGEMRVVPGACLATYGVASNQDNKNTKIGKAGRKRWMGVRPTVRGVAMNPVDHPHGGGEGRTSGGRHPSTPWGVATKGKRTRKNKQTDKYIIARRDQRKKRG